MQFIDEFDKISHLECIVPSKAIKVSQTASQVSQGSETGTCILVLAASDETRGGVFLVDRKTLVEFARVTLRELEPDLLSDPTFL